jgi:hypothetical protein
MGKENEPVTQEEINALMLRMMYMQTRCIVKGSSIYDSDFTNEAEYTK